MQVDDLGLYLWLFGAFSLSHDAMLAFSLSLNYLFTGRYRRCRLASDQYGISGTSIVSISPS